MAAIGISLKPKTNMLNTGATRKGDFMSHRYTFKGKCEYFRDRCTLNRSFHGAPVSPVPYACIFLRKHSIVFSMRHVMVIGPTPPGTGVMTEAFGSTAA